MRIYRRNKFEAIVYLGNGRMVTLSCSEGRIDKLIEWYLLPFQNNFKDLKEYNRVLLDSMEDTTEILLPMLPKKVG